MNHSKTYEDFQGKEILNNKLSENIVAIVETIINDLWKGKQLIRYDKNDKAVNAKIEQAILTMAIDYLRKNQDEDFNRVIPNNFKSIASNYLDQEWYKQFLSPYKNIDFNFPIVIDNWPLQKHDKYNFLNNKVTLTTRFDYTKWLREYIDKWWAIIYKNYKYSEKFLTQLRGEKITIPKDTKLYWSNSINLFVHDTHELEFTNMGHSNFYTLDGWKIDEFWKVQYGEKINHPHIIMYKDTIPNDIPLDILEEAQKAYLIDEISGILYRIFRDIKYRKK